MDKLSSLVGRHSFNARLFYNGAFCDTNQFTENGVSGQLHVVRREGVAVALRRQHLQLLRGDREIGRAHV